MLRDNIDKGGRKGEQIDHTDIFQRYYLTYSLIKISSLQKRKKMRLQHFVLPFAHAVESLSDMEITNSTSHSAWFPGPETRKWQTTLLALRWTLFPGLHTLVTANGLSSLLIN